MTTSKLTLADLLKVSVDASLNDIHTCIPALVEEYDRTTQRVSVQPALKRKYADGTIVNLPIIKNVPVTFQRSGKHILHFDLEKGDEVTLVFSERSLDKWKEKGGLVSPDDRRKFSLSDAYAIPGGCSKASPISLNGEKGDIELSNGTNYFIIKEDGKIEGKNGGGTFSMNSSGKFVLTNGTEEFVSLMSDLIQDLIDALVLTAIGPQPFTPETIAKLTILKTKLGTLKE